MPGTSHPTTASPAPGPHRLPYSVTPLTYRLTLSPDLDAARFSGSVAIDVEVHEPVTQIVCNAAELVIHDATVQPAGGDPVAVTATVDEEAERVTFALPAPIGPGPATLSCTFSGVLNDMLRGFYRSTFTDDDGATRTIATSQMEATDARRAFPCWDEPDRKAVFEVTLEVTDRLAAYSNSAVVAEEAVPGTSGGRPRRRVRFAPTMKMSTYLVALVVGPLEATDPVDVDGVPVRIVHAPGKDHLTSYALEVAAHALRFFAAYFDIPYPADKLDLVAIPDFAAGAMENLGCVTFRETALLIDPASAARTELERVADVVCHEIAHMWFGDLVTMGWWEGIWLNEAFATFMEVLAVDAFRPAWQRWVGFGLERESALAVDGLHATRPIEYPVASPDEADGMFDVLTYQKGGSVLRMLEQYLGPDTFRDGVRRYLRRHAYANTVTADLWNALEEASGEPVRAVMDSWILQGGHPLVTLSAGTLSQEPFTYRPADDGEESAIGTAWQVPVLVRTLEGGETSPGAGSPAEAGDGTARLLLTTAPAPLPSAAAGPALPVVNAGGWGVYRVGYPADHLAALAERLPALEPLERFELFSDTWALVLAGRSDLAGFLTLAAAVGDEDEPAIFSVIAGAMDLCDRVVGDGERATVQAATHALLGPRAAALGWEPRTDEGERVPTLRALLISELGSTGVDAAVQAEAARRFDEARGGGPAIDPNLESAVLRAVTAQCRPGDYDTLADRYRHPATPQEELRHLMALATFPDVDLSLRTFDLATTEVRTQNAPYLVGALLANRVGGPAVWEQVKEEWATLRQRFPANSHSRMLNSARTLCGDEALAEDVTRFLTDHPLQTGQRSIAQMLERLRINVAFAAHQRHGVGGALAGLAKDGAASG